MSPSNLEIVAFYPTQKIKIKGKKWAIFGTMHIYLPDFKMDIRGIKVLRHRHGFHFQLPLCNGEIDGKPCKFPQLDFRDKTEHKKFLSVLKKKGTEFLTK